MLLRYGVLLSTRKLRSVHASRNAEPTDASLRANLAPPSTFQMPSSMLCWRAFLVSNRKRVRMPCNPDELQGIHESVPDDEKRPRYGVRLSRRKLRSPLVPVMLTRTRHVPLAPDADAKVPFSDSVFE